MQTEEYLNGSHFGIKFNSMKQSCGSDSRSRIFAPISVLYGIAEGGFYSKLL